MRFNSAAYDKLFPRQTEQPPVPETPVETFRPSQKKDHIEKPVEDSDPVEDVNDQFEPEEQEVNNDDGSAGQPDPE